MPPITIMTVDDDPIIRLALKKILQRDNCTVTEASDGQEALEKIRSQKPNLVILDIHMPRMTGWQLIRNLRTNPIFSLIPVIFLSAVTPQQNQLQGFRLGADTYIEKPFSPKQIITATIDTLKKSQEFRAQFNITNQDDSFPEEEVNQYIEESDEILSIDEFEAMENLPKTSPVQTILSGSLKQIGLSSVLSMINLEQKTGILILHNPDNTQQVEVSLVNGEVYQASSTYINLENEEAIYNALTWKSGKFAFYYGEVDVENQINSSITSLLLEGARRIDEVFRDEEEKLS
ncbi:response regulator [Candidatus Uabimicrobium sp. HlEnr_7]|uniref:response regulator n=1 Tax=Candidatus Uabimicrobium helgolandensis TaxID=3095367 RepID=UPI003558B06A